jgi:hypothetical protein
MSESHYTIWTENYIIEKNFTFSSALSIASCFCMYWQMSIFYFPIVIIYPPPMFLYCIVQIT